MARIPAGLLSLSVLLVGCGARVPAWTHRPLSPHLETRTPHSETALTEAAATWNGVMGHQIIVIDGPDPLVVEATGSLGSIVANSRKYDVLGTWDGHKIRFLEELDGDDPRLVGVLTHELGHALGLWDEGRHNPNPNSVMALQIGAQTQPDSLDVAELQGITR